VIGNMGLGAGMDHLGSLVVVASVAGRGVPVVAVPKTVDNHCKAAAQGANWFEDALDVADCMAADSAVHSGYSAAAVAAADYPDAGSFDSRLLYHSHHCCHLAIPTEKPEDGLSFPSRQDCVCSGSPHLCRRERLVECFRQCLLDRGKIAKILNIAERQPLRGVASILAWCLPSGGTQSKLSLDFLTLITIN
jgi:hypothetical protein